jgi:hypothetical protein
VQTARQFGQPELGLAAQQPLGCLHDELSLAKDGRLGHQLPAQVEQLSPLRLISHLQPVAQNSVSVSAPLTARIVPQSLSSNNYRF